MYSFVFFEFSKLNIYRGVFHFDGFDIKSYYVCNSSAMKSNAMICSLKIRSQILMKHDWDKKFRSIPVMKQMLQVFIAVVFHETS